MWRPFVLASLALVLATSHLVAQPASPCGEADPYGALDFWVGEWRVVNAEGATVGTNRIEKRQAGCLIEENWSSAGGGTGQSMNYYDPAAGLWKQHWVDGRGTVVHYAGTVTDGVLVYEGQHIRADGTVTMARVRLEPIEEGRLHHLIEHSPDGGDTWTNYFDATYVPLGGQIASASDEARAESDDDVLPRPATTAAEAPSAGALAAAEPGEEEIPAAEPVEEEAVPEQAPGEATQDQAVRQARETGSEVTAVSRVLGREEIPTEQAPELRMASPMVLEIVPGPIDALPENTAWPTEETNGFICNDIVVEKVTLARRAKGERVEIEVAAQLYTAKRLRRADLLLELLLGDEVLASEELRKIRVGLNIPAHGDEGLWVSAELSVSRQEFEQLFADGADRKLRLTLTAP
ncbi:MAG: hypothetical protein R3244_02675 [Thermoanaerobaculia bacterium]|nr:hypothetical protein [Thermoanaerobaculia bacterium]